MPIRPRAARLRPTLALATLLALSVPGIAAAHAELAVATPPDGSTVEGTPAEVAGTYTQDLKVDGSSLQLRDERGEVIAKGGVDPGDVRRMVIDDLPALAAGRYEVRWTTSSAEDDEVARDRWTFTVVAAATPAPTATPLPTATAGATIGPATASPAASGASPAASDASPAPSAPPTPTPSADPGGQGGDGSDATLTVVTGLLVVTGLAIVGAAVVILLRRRGRTGPPA